MVTCIYTQPHATSKKDCWLIGWSKTQFEKAKSNLFHFGDYESAAAKIAGMNCKKYIRKP